MHSILYKYLALYKKLDVPGIGNFTIETTPATLHFTDKQLQPSSSHIRFAQVVHPTNNHFYSFLSREWGVEKVIAIRRYKEEVEVLMEDLKRLGMCELKYIGILRKTNNETIAFTETEPSFPLFSVLPAERVLRKHTQHTILVGEQEHVKDYVMPEENGEIILEEDVANDKWKLYAMILAAIAVVMIVVYYAVM